MTVPLRGTWGLLQDRLIVWMDKTVHRGGGRLFVPLFCLGASGSAGLAPYAFLPMMIFSLGALYRFLLVASDSAMDGPRTMGVRRGFTIGFSWALGYFTFSLYWIAVSLTIDLDRFWFLIPFSVLGVPALLAMFWGAAGALLTGFRVRGLAHLLGFVLMFSLAEWVRGHALTGFPWALPGYGFMGYNGLAQGFSVVGAYGMTLIMFLLAPWGAMVCVPDGRQGKWVTIIYGAGFAGLLMVLGIVGSIRLKETVTYVPSVVLRLVQPAIPQSLKWDPERARDHFDHLLALSTEGDLRPGFVPTHVIWPESAAPYYLTSDGPKRHEASRVIPHGGALLTGTIRMWRDGVDRTIHARNSLVVINTQGRVVGGYDKSHLVPFGEYVPLRFLMPSIIQKVTHGAVDYEPGPGPMTVMAPALPPFSPLICYEGIFPGAVIHDDGRARWLLNITNDGWFGRTSGPYQHLDINRARAIEEGLPLVRVANTGISAVIDGYGRSVAVLDLGVSGVLDSRLPNPVPHPTLYHRFHNSIFWVLWALFLLIMAIVHLRPRSRYE